MKEDFFNPKNARRVEHCDKCSHPSKKCLICGKAEDDVMNEQKAEIDVLRSLLSKKNLQIMYGTGKMEELIVERVDTYERTKRDQKLCLGVSL